MQAVREDTEDREENYVLAQNTEARNNTPSNSNGSD